MSGFKSMSLLPELKKHSFILKGFSQLINLHKCTTDTNGDRKLYSMSSSFDLNLANSTFPWCNVLTETLYTSTQKINMHTHTRFSLFVCLFKP